MTKDEFLRKVQERLGTTDKEEAEMATRSVLAAVADRISQPEAKDLASQLPQGLQDLVQSRSGPVQEMDMDTFITRIQSDLDIETWDHAASVARAVFAVLKEAVSEGEWKDVASQFPAELQHMFVTA